MSDLELTPELAAEIDAMPCAMYTQDPFPFAWCETHDTTFPLGGVCPAYGPEVEPGPCDPVDADRDEKPEEYGEAAS